MILTINVWVGGDGRKAVKSILKIVLLCAIKIKLNIETLSDYGYTFLAFKWLLFLVLLTKYCE
jgi:hypothetical protein